jgi:hypothetical protein
MKKVKTEEVQETKVEEKKVPRLLPVSLEFRQVHQFKHIGAYKTQINVSELVHAKLDHEGLTFLFNTDLNLYKHIPRSEIIEVIYRLEE